jgi:hypothetical protein
MKIESEFDKCIYCLENPADSWEHIIPESIGGRLQIKALCSRCNNTLLGSELISKVRMAADVRRCIQNLKREIPDLYESMENGLPYLAEGNDNKVVKLIRKKAGFVVLSQQKEDGSIIYDTKKAKKHISNMLKNEGLRGHEIAEKIDSLKRLKSGETLRLSDNLRAGTRETGPIEPCFVGPKEKGASLLDEKVIVLMAYEFLSLLVGDLILDKKFGLVREFVRNGTTSKDLIIEHLTSRRYSPSHGIYPELLENEFIIKIILFGWMVYRVHLKGLNLSSHDLVYEEDLKKQATLLQSCRSSMSLRTA